MVNRPKVVSEYIETSKKRQEKYPRVPLDPEGLRWTPPVSHLSLDDEFEMSFDREVG